MSSPFVLVIAAAARLILISDGDTTVASSIAAAGGVTGSLVGTVIPLLPPYLPLLVLVFVLFRRLVLAAVIAVVAVLVSPAYDSASDGWNRAVSSIPAMFNHVIHGEWGALYRDGPGVVASVILGVVFAFWGVSEVASREPSRFLVVVAQVRFIVFGLICGAICTLGLLFMLAVYRVPFDANNAAQIMRRPWLPAEEIQTNAGDRRVGFVITTKDGWFLLMNESNRSLEYIPAGSVVRRQVCTPPSYQVEYRPPLIDIRGGSKPSSKVCAPPLPR